MEPFGFHDPSDHLTPTTDALANYKLLKGAVARSLNSEPTSSPVDDVVADVETPSRPEPTVTDYELSPELLAGIIVAAALFSVAVIAIAVWFHVRRKKSKNLPVEPQPPPSTVSVIMDTDTKTIASRQNSGSGGYNGPYGYHHYGAGYGSYETDEEVGTEYGSVIGSFPPSPALSFRSALDGPGFSRSRTGTGTSFGTVASFGSHRSRLSTTASFQTCFEEELS